MHFRDKGYHCGRIFSDKLAKRLVIALTLSKTRTIWQSINLRVRKVEFPWSFDGSLCYSQPRMSEPKDTGPGAGLECKEGAGGEAKYNGIQSEVLYSDLQRSPAVCLGSAPSERVSYAFFDTSLGVDQPPPPASQNRRWLHTHFRSGGEMNFQSESLAFDGKINCL